MLSLSLDGPDREDPATVLYLIYHQLYDIRLISLPSMSLLDSVPCVPVNYIMWSYCIQLHMQANLSEWYRVYPCSRVVCAVSFDMCRVALTVHCELLACASHQTYPLALVCTARVPYQHFLIYLFKSHITNYKGSCFLNQCIF